MLQAYLDGSQVIVDQSSMGLDESPVVSQDSFDAGGGEELPLDGKGGNDVFVNSTGLKSVALGGAGDDTLVFVLPPPFELFEPGPHRLIGSQDVLGSLAQYPSRHCAARLGNVAQSFFLFTTVATAGCQPKIVGQGLRSFESVDARDARRNATALNRDARCLHQQLGIGLARTSRRSRRRVAGHEVPIAPGLRSRGPFQCGRPLEA